VDVSRTEVVERTAPSRPGVGVVVGVALAVAVVGVAVGAAFAARGDSPQAPAVAAAASTLSVACSPSGITVSARAVAATAAGVVVRVSSTMPAGAYLNYLWSGAGVEVGGGGGEAMPPEPATWTLLAPPGPLTLSCTSGGDPAPAAVARVTVSDPGAHWRSATLEELGCPSGGILDWAGPAGSGATPEAAVREVLARFAPAQAPGLTVTRAEVGYPEAASQVWLASAEGTPYLAIGVSRQGSRFSASPAMFCGR